MVEKPGPEIILSVANINKASFLGSFRVTVSHEVCMYVCMYCDRNEEGASYGSARNISPP